MPFVKLDTGILDSTLWVDRDVREVFITALLMAGPTELTEPTPQYELTGFELTGFAVPPGWYGLVPAASVGIIRRSGLEEAAGMAALDRLGKPEAESRSPEFEGRRMVRISGGFIILNFQKYRDRDYTAADRSRRYRERQANPSQRDDTPSQRNITQAEAEAEEEKDNRGVADRIFDHWKTTFEKHRSVLDPKRRRLINDAVKRHGEADVVKSISGFRKSPFHMGDNDRHKTFHDIELILRDAKHVEEGIALYEKGGGGDPNDPFRGAING